MIRITAPDIYENDAVGNFCIDLAGCLRANGFATALYAQHFSTQNDLAIQDMAMLGADVAKEDIIITSYSIYDPYLDAITSLPNRKLCYFHSVTPPELLERFEPVTAALCRRSQEQFPQLGLFDILVANSQYTAAYLASFIKGREILEVPPIFATRPLLADRENETPFPQTGTDILMVGRVVPHKNIEEAIALFAALRRHIPKATLTIVGEHPNQDYFHFLQRCAADLEMTQEDIIFTGKVDGTELRNRYRAASALLCVSLHEGFCIPVLEAMQFGVPVFVRTGNAAGEVAAGAGMLFEDDDVPAIARRVADTLASPPKLSAHIAAGKARAAALISRNSPAFWLTQLSALRVTRYLESASLT